MRKLGDVFLEASCWKAALVTMLSKLENIYQDPQDRKELLKPYKQFYNIAISTLDAKLQECLDYRALSLSSIHNTRVPDMYPSHSDDTDMLNGLVGLAYIGRPLNIRGSIFKDVDYIGFALPDCLGSLTPWMSGTARRSDKRRTLIGRGHTPKLLEVAV